MKLTCVYLVFVISTLSFSANAQQPTTVAQQPPETTWVGMPDGIVKALKDYINGAQKGNQDQLARSFETETGMMYSVRRTKENDELRATTFEQFVSFFSEPNLLPTSGRILSFDIVEDHMAFVKFEYIEDKDRYVDYLTFMQINGNWRIVAKAYLYQPNGG